MAKRYPAESFEIDEDYFLWLCELVGADDPDQGYLGVLRTMYDTEFSDRTSVLVSHDDNRIADGLELRDRYKSETLYDIREKLDGPCSILEMMIALAHRMASDFDYGTETSWFWVMMKNLGLSDYKDDRYYEVDGIDRVYKILRNLRRRNYNPDGSGGLFPLKKASRDQRDVEIWYQMQAFITEDLYTPW